MSIESGNLIDFSQRQFHLLGERAKMYRGQLAMCVLDQVQMFNQKIALPRPVTKQ
jgi:hypothetical protein